MVQVLSITRCPDTSTLLYEFDSGVAPAAVVFNTISDGDSATFNAIALELTLRDPPAFRANASFVCFVCAPHPQTTTWAVLRDFNTFVNDNIRTRLATMTQRRFQLVPVQDFQQISATSPVLTRLPGTSQYEVEELVIHMVGDDDDNDNDNDRSGEGDGKQGDSGDSADAGSGERDGKQKGESDSAEGDGKQEGESGEAEGE